MTASEDDPLIPVMLPTSVVEWVVKHWEGMYADDPTYAPRVLTDACRDALPKRVTIEIDERTRDLLAGQNPGAYVAEIEDVMVACRASRDAEVEAR